MMSPCSLVRPLVLSKVSESERGGGMEWRERDRANNISSAVGTDRLPLQVASIAITVACSAVDAQAGERASALARFFILFLICIVRCPFVRPSYSPLVNAKKTSRAERRRRPWCGRR